MSAQVVAVQFDYKVLDAETRSVVQQRTAEIKTIARRAATRHHRDRAEADRCEAATGTWPVRRVAPGGVRVERAERATLHAGGGAVPKPSN